MMNETEHEATTEVRFAKMEGAMVALSENVSSFITAQKHENSQLKDGLIEVKDEVSKRGRLSWPLVLAFIGAFVTIVTPASAVIAMYVNGKSAQHASTQSALRSRMDDAEAKNAEELKYRREFMDATMKMTSNNTAEIERMAKENARIQGNRWTNEHMILKDEVYGERFKRIEETTDLKVANSELKTALALAELNQANQSE